ncbi:MAG: choice-of-anchor D domain-containing protein, partial [Rhodothermales bacterium]|nr:choice-of-anchor D domain-containing protein [Rhodothermales bacterium]
MRLDKLLLGGFLFGLLFVLSTPGDARAQPCTTPAATSGLTANAGVAEGAARGTFWTADCSGTVESVTFVIATATPFVEVLLFEGRPGTSMTQLATSGSVVSALGANTVPFLAPPSISTGSEYTMVVRNAEGAAINIQQTTGVANGVNCEEFAPEASNFGCVEPGDNTVNFDIALGTPEITVSDNDDTTIVAGSTEATIETSTLFEAIEVGSSASASFRIDNAGLETLTITGLSPGLGEASDFSVSGLALPADVAAGQSTTFAVEFAPTDGGLRTDFIQISSNAENAGAFTFAVQGTGLMDFGDYSGAAAPLKGANSSVTGARHVPTGPVLGAARDAEAGFESNGLEPDPGQSKFAGTASTLTASADDFDGEIDDEDGVIFPFYDMSEAIEQVKTSNTPHLAAILPSGSTIGLTVELSDAPSAYLNVWLDWFGESGTLPNFVFEGAEELLVENLPILEGSNTVTIDVPVFNTQAAGKMAASLESAMRFRVTSQPMEEPSASTFASDGEVEDHPVLLSSDPVPVTSSGLGSGSVSINSDGQIVQTNAAGQVTAVLDPNSVSTITITGDNSDETITLDEDLLNLGITVNVNLGGGFDTLVINKTDGTTQTITHTFDNATDGSFSTDMGGTVNYTGVDPITDNLDVADRVFTFTGVGSETIVLSPDGDGALGNGMSFIDSDFAEEVSFANPTNSLTINVGTGDNTVVIGALDTALDPGFTGITVNGGADPDRFTVTPSSYPITVDGAA